MRLLHTDRSFKIVLALLAIILLGMAIWIWVRLHLAAPASPPLPERVEWQSDPQSGAASLLLHGLDGRPVSGVLVPVTDDERLYPGLPGIWRELSVVRQRELLAEQRDGFDGLQVFNFSQPPATMSSNVHSLHGNPLNVAIRGQRLWLACKKSGLSVVDLADPLNPKLHKAWPAPLLRDVVFAGDRAYLLNANARLDIVELVSPRQVRPLAYRILNHPDSEYLGMTVHHGRLLLIKVDVKTKRLFLSFSPLDPQGIPASDFTDVLLPVFLNGHCWWRDGRLYLADLAGRFFGIDVEEPSAPRVFVETVLPARLDRMVWMGNRWLAHLGDDSVYTFPGEPSAAKGWDARYLGQEQDGFPAWLLLAAGRLYAFSPQRGIEVFPSLPVVAAAAPAVITDTGFPGENWPDDVLQAVPLPTGYALLGADGLVRLISAVNRHLPVIATIETGEQSRWLAAYEDRLYVGGGERIAVVRVDARGLPRFTGGIDLPGKLSFDAAVVDGTLCIAAGRSGVAGFSLADPDRPRPLPDVQFPPLLQQRLDVRSVAVQGRQLFAAGGGGGVLSLVADRDRQVRLVGVRPLAGPVHAVAVSGSLLLASTGENIEMLAMSPSGPADKLQALGALPLKDVQRLTFPGKGRIGVQRAVGGWRFSPPPALLPGLTGAPPRLLLPPTVEPGNYRLVLFNEEGTAEWPEVLAVPGQGPPRQGAG